MAITKVAEAANSGNVAGNTGVVVTHGFTLVNGDVLYAFVGAGTATIGGSENITAFACSGWTQLDFEQQAGGNDRASAVLRKVITDAGSEGSTYTFTRTGDTVTRNQKVVIYQLRGVDTTTPEDATTTKADVTNDFTPDNVDITTVTAGAWVLAFHYASFGDTEAITGITPGAPTDYTLSSNAAPFDANGTTTPRGGMVAVAHREIASPGAQSIGSWTHSPDDSTREGTTWAVAVRPAAVSDGPGFIGGGFF